MKKRVEYERNERMSGGEIKERMERWMSDIRKRRDGGENYEDGCWRDGGMEERRTKKK